MDFKYDPFALNKTIDNVSFHIPEGKVTAIVGAYRSGKTTSAKIANIHEYIMSLSLKYNTLYKMSLL